jgi:hypothetical protein
MKLQIKLLYLILFVAFIAVGLGIHNSCTYREHLANHYARVETQWLQRAADATDEVDHQRHRFLDAIRVESEREALRLALEAELREKECLSLAVYYGQLREKYRLAARYPFLPIMPDPPPPDVHRLGKASEMLIDMFTRPSKMDDPSVTGKADNRG